VLFLQKLKLDVDGEFLEKLEKENNVVKELLNAKMENAKKTAEKCIWFGPVISQSFSSKCVRTIVAKNTTRKRCCKYLKHCHGNQCKLSRLNCKFVGKRVKIVKRKKCTMRREKRGKRKVCCSFTLVCKGSKCKKRHLKCKKVGLLFRESRKCSCSFVKKSSTERQRRCCCKRTVCYGIDCKVRENKCSWQGSVLSSKWIHHCRQEKYGKNGSRKRCCSVHKKCHANFCRNTRKVCQWKGPVTKVTLSKKCFTKRVSPREVRNICCNYERICVGRHCEKKTKQNCNVERTVIRKNKEECVLTQSKSGKCQRTRCCKWVEKCVNGKCHHAKKRCAWRGQASCTKRVCDCLWKQKTNKCQQRKCCCKKTVCHGRLCVTKNAKCFWSGKKICNKRNRSNCDWKPVSNEGRQLHCCSHKKVDPLCRHKCEKRRECKFVGKVHSSKTTRDCKYLEIKKGLSRKHCCIVTKECVGDKCVEKRSKCKFTGSIARDGCLYRKKRVCKRAHHGASFKCNMAIEPSFKSFNGKSFNNLTSGKLLIVKKKGTFSVKAERSKWDRSVVTTRLFVAKGKKQSRTRVSTISAGRFVVDGKHVSLKVKRSITTSNLLIKRESKNTVVIQTKKRKLYQDYI